MELFFIAFLAGVITVLTPCVLPVLPVILGGSLSGTDRWRPLIITGSLMISVFLFTLLLKASTLLIQVPPSVWTGIAGGIVLLFGLALFFPNTWSALSQRLGFERSQNLLQSASQQEGRKGMIFLGASLGPVFASCSPTYALILAVVLPQSFSMGIWALVFYCLGLFLPLILIGYGGRQVLGGFRWFANPESWFRRGLGALLIVVGILILTGYEKKLEAALLDQGYFDFTKLEQGLVEGYQNGVTEQEKDMVMDMAKNQSVVRDSTASAAVRALFNAHFPAPELVEPTNWINSEPLTLAQLRQQGKVVMIDFWTYSCINCIRTLPALKMLHEEYADEGLVILGAHAPEFAFEKVLANLQQKVEEFALPYPIFQDNDFKTWRAYKNRYWPAKYVIDRDGFVRYTHFGEGEYEETEQVIRSLLGLDGAENQVDFSAVEAPSDGVQTGETYLGTERHVVAGTSLPSGTRQAVFASPESVSESVQKYTRPKTSAANQWWLTGAWRFEGEKIVSSEEETSIGLVYSAKQANLVMGFTEHPVEVEVWLDGKRIQPDQVGRMVQDGRVLIDAYQLYFLSEHQRVEEHTLELRFKGKGVELYAWTFG
ncbi:MAG: redoxin domain-containing protein [bacterium]|nr:redoxin domain-containing protein [bacterium]